MYQIALYGSFFGALISIGAVGKLYFRRILVRGPRSSPPWSSPRPKKEHLQDLGILEIRPKTTKVKSQAEALSEELNELRKQQDEILRDIESGPITLRLNRAQTRLNAVSTGFTDLVKGLAEIEDMATKVRGAKRPKSRVHRRRRR